MWRALVLLCLGVCHASTVSAFPRPPHTDHAKLARWLVHMNDWGSLATTSAQGNAVGGVVSFSDGAADDASGRLFFYLTPMDETAQNIESNPRCALTISEAQMLPSGCDDTDPEDPTCARISVLGSMLPVPAGHDEEAAAAALFSRHPAMQDWPADHGFKLYELRISNIHMLDWYGGMHIIPADEYYAADLTPDPQQAGVRVQHQHQQQAHKQVRVALRGVRRVAL